VSAWHAPPLNPVECGIFLNTAADTHLLPKILDAASRYNVRPDDDAMTAMLEQQAVTTLFGLSPTAIR
jgi:hypothetical protein